MLIKVHEYRTNKVIYINPLLVQNVTTHSWTEGIYNVKNCKYTIIRYCDNSIEAIEDAEIIVQQIDKTLDKLTTIVLSDGRNFHRKRENEE